MGDRGNGNEIFSVIPSKREIRTLEHHNEAIKKGMSPEGDSAGSVSQTPSDVKMELDENSTKNDTMQNVKRTDTEQVETPRQSSSNTDIENYIKDQVEKQKKSTSGGLMQKIRDVKDQLRH